jgi:DNA-binding NarL/FixJ family response regulator
VSSAGTRKRKARVPQSSLGGPAGAQCSSTELRATQFELAGDDYVVLSYPRTEFVALAELTSSERAVFLSLLSGQSNKQIAVSRGRSPRTVANQVATIFQKLGIGSRAALFAKYGGRY